MLEVISFIKAMIIFSCALLYAIFVTLMLVTLSLIMYIVTGDFVWFETVSYNLEFFLMLGLSVSTVKELIEYQDVLD